MNATATRTYSLRQAADLTGFSLGKFRYNRELLTNNGVTITDEGWRIPHTTLETLGWLGVKPSREPLPAMSALETAEARIRELEAENTALRAQVDKPRGLFGRRK